MVEIINNINNLDDSDITDFSVKVKLLLVNSKGELLLAYSHNEYQFPGGTKESNEDIVDTVYRELREETGIILNNLNLEPIIKSSGYYKDWPFVGRNKRVDIYYYEIEIDEKPNLDNLDLTDNEKNGNFLLKYVSLDNVFSELDRNVLLYGDKHGIAREMKEVLKIYLKGER